VSDQASAAAAIPSAETVNQAEVAMETNEVEPAIDQDQPSELAAEGKISAFNNHSGLLEACTRVEP